MGEFRDKIYFSPKLENTEFTIYFCNKVMLLYSKSVKSCHFLCRAVKPSMENQRNGKEVITQAKCRIFLFILAWLMINFKTWALPEKNPAIPYKSLYLNIVNFKLVLVFFNEEEQCLLVLHTMEH